MGTNGSCHDNLSPGKPEIWVEIECSLEAPHLIPTNRCQKRELNVRFAASSCLLDKENSMGTSMEEWNNLAWTIHSSTVRSTELDDQTGSITWKESQPPYAADHSRENWKPGNRFKPKNNIVALHFRKGILVAEWRAN